MVGGELCQTVHGQLRMQDLSVDNLEGMVYTINLPVSVSLNICVVSSTGSYFYGHDENLPVVMSNVNCLGTESRLIDCSYNIGGSGLPVSLQCTYDGKIDNWPCLCT